MGILYEDLKVGQPYNSERPIDLTANEKYRSQQIMTPVCCNNDALKIKLRIGLKKEIFKVSTDYKTVK